MKSRLKHALVPTHPISLSICSKATARHTHYSLSLSLARARALSKRLLALLALLALQRLKKQVRAMFYSSRRSSFFATGKKTSLIAMKA
jgi:hypothetical protein